MLLSKIALIPMIIIAIIALQKKILSKFSFSKLPTFFLPVLLIFPLIVSPILDFGGKSIGQDLALFLIGYYVLSEDSILEKMTKYRHIYLIIMLICDIPSTFPFVWEGQQTGIVITLCTAGATWFGVLGFIGFAKCRYNQNNAITKYMSANSFLIYIFHFGWLIAIQYYLSKAALNITLTYILSIAVTLLLTLLTCEIVKRVPGLRFLFGVSKKNLNLIKYIRELFEQRAYNQEAPDCLWTDIMAVHLYAGIQKRSDSYIGLSGLSFTKCLFNAGSVRLCCYA